MVLGLVPLGSALVQVAKMPFFTRILLGSGLGSTWFLLGSSLCEPQKTRFRLGEVEKMLGSGLGSTWFRIGPNYESGLGTTCFLLGSSLCEPHQSRFRLGGVEEMLGSGFGSSWFRLGSYLVPTCVSHKVEVSPRVWSEKMLGAGLDSTWFLLGSSLCEPQKSRFRLGGVEQMLGSGLGSTWFRLGSCAHGWQSLPEAQVCSLAA